MSRFYASISGSARTTATRQGQRSIHSHTTGWDVGVAVSGAPDPNLSDRDIFDIYATAGSDNPSSRTHLGTVSVDVDGTPHFTPNKGEPQ